MSYTCEHCKASLTSMVRLINHHETKHAETKTHLKLMAMMGDYPTVDVATMPLPAEAVHEVQQAAAAAKPKAKAKDAPTGMTYPQFTKVKHAELKETYPEFGERVKAIAALWREFKTANTVTIDIETTPLAKPEPEPEVIEVPKKPVKLDFCDYESWVVGIMHYFAQSGIEVAMGDVGDGIFIKSVSWDVETEVEAEVETEVETAVETEVETEVEPEVIEPEVIEPEVIEPEVVEVVDCVRVHEPMHEHDMGGGLWSSPCEMTDEEFIYRQSPEHLRKVAEKPLVAVPKGYSSEMEYMIINTLGYTSVDAYERAKGIGKYKGQTPTETPRQTTDDDE